MLAIFIADAENVEIILKSKDCFNKPNLFYKMMRDGIGVDGLITSRGEVLRRYVKSGFYIPKKTVPVNDLLHMYCDTFQKKNGNLIEN